MSDLKIFSSYNYLVNGKKRVVIITKHHDDFGNVNDVENLITIEHAKEILQNLKNTIEEYERTSI